MTASGDSEPLINLLRGWPNPELLPLSHLKQAANNVLSDTSVAYPGLLYGPDEGDPRLRTAIAKWLTGFYKPMEPITDSRITITGGASQNLGCILQVFTDALYTRNIWIVAPAYMLAFRIFQDNGFAERLRAVPEDEEGIDIEFLRTQLRSSEEKAQAEGNVKPTLKPSRPWGKIYRHIIYAVPTFSNPSSKTMSLRRREDIVRLAREYDALVVTDDVYDFLQWPASTSSSQSALDRAILPRLVDIDRELEGGSTRPESDGFGNVASNGSFSKIMGPGIRTGWVEGTEKFAYGVSQTGTSTSGGAPSQYAAVNVANLLETGVLQRYITHTLQPALASRYRQMMSAVNERLVPLGLSLSQADRDVAGGYFIWVSLPRPLRGARVARRAKDKQNLIVAQGEMFEVPGDQGGARFPHDIRLCFSWEQEEHLQEGVRRLGKIIEEMLREREGGAELQHQPDDDQNGPDQAQFV